MNRRSLMVGAGATFVVASAGAVAWKASVGSAAEYQAYTARLRSDLTLPDIGNVVRYASLAANSHNTQPWYFRAKDRVIEILPDLSRRTPAVDPDDHHLFVSLGCAAANLAIAAASSGRLGEIAVAPDGSIRYEFVTGQARQEPLLPAIAKRQSTRSEYDRRSVSTADLALLERAAAIPGVKLILVVDRARIGRVRDLVVAGNDEQMADPAFMAELKHWLRFNPRSAMASGDGLFSAATGNPSIPTALGRLAFDNLFDARSEGEKYARHIDSSAGIAVFVGDREDREHWIRVGQACQRFALMGTSLGLKLAFINQPAEVTRLRPEMAGLVGETRRPDIIMRFGYAPTLPYSPRRPVNMVLA
ncbi:Tat pathway signal protein [Mesorhizobium helmanticense]|uniref:Tat pathway signal protein n=2 Tax=Mesorhizobium helmanticense TaxID=1776423 RepID=A0A2T4J1F1_9HYPH|nr:nitroreductase family protein [Mesorhizobium helmanticense]PTE11663.1 Tat pathway signal protein [Mesorhizobium helmanticense]